MKDAVYEPKAPQERDAILLAGFGTLSELEKDFRAAFPGRPVFTARTAAEGLERFSADRFFVQPAYLLPGAEFDRLREEAARSGKRTVCGVPLLSEPENLRALARILSEEYGGQAVVFAGHGSRHPAGKRYAQLAVALREAGFAQSFVGVLEGEPGFESVADGLAQSGVRQVLLVPLMLSLGMHARRQILGEEGESWDRRLRAFGISVRPVVRALLDDPAVRRMFIESARARLKH